MEEMIIEEMKKEMAQVMRKLALLEQHMINLIVPIQNISSLLTNPGEIREIVQSIRYFHSNPLKIDDSPLRKACKEVRDELNEMNRKIPPVDLAQAFAEMKYIGNRMLEMEKALVQIEAKGLKNDVVITVNRGDMEVEECGSVKKEKKDITPLAQLLDSLPDKCAEYLEEYLISNGKIRNCNLVKKWGVSSTKISQVIKRCQRSLSRDSIVKIIESIEDGNTKRLIKIFLRS